jgi:hypothetical protein
MGKKWAVPKEAVRSRAEDTIPDINHILKWKIANYHKMDRRDDDDNEGLIRR